MTSLHEMHSYAQEAGDSDEWSGLPANGGGWDKPANQDELIAAAHRMRRYNDEPPDSGKWHDDYEASQQYGNDMAMLADYAVFILFKEPRRCPMTT